MVYLSSGKIYTSSNQKETVIFFPLPRKVIFKNPFPVIVYLVLYNHSLLYEDHVQKQERT